MAEFKVGDRVRIIKNYEDRLLVASPFQGFNYLGFVGTIKEIKGRNVYFRDIVCVVDISCIEYDKEVLKIKINGKYIYRSFNGSLRLSTEAPKLDKHDWRDSGHQWSAESLIIDLSQFNWNDSLHMINDDYTLTKIEPELCKAYIIKLGDMDYIFSEEDLDKLIKAARDSGYKIKEN